jgi:hypothetical protein
VSDRLAVGTTVSFDFDLPRASTSCPRERRTGTGVVVEERNYQCWPVGVTVRVVDSPDYAAGTAIAVCTHNLSVRS